MTQRKSEEIKNKERMKGKEVKKGTNKETKRKPPHKPTLQIQI